jgi:class 3 adenylate cyclase
VNVAARLAGEAQPNEARISAAIRAAARAGLTRDLGLERELVLRGIDRPISAWRLA